MELSRNPDNFFAEVEQSAFNPANVVPGIGFSQPSALLRLMSPAQQQALFENTARSIGEAPALPRRWAFR